MMDARLDGAVGLLQQGSSGAVLEPPSPGAVYL